MDKHFKYTKPACDFCMNGITTESGICPIPTCGLAVFLHTLIGGMPIYPVSIMPECGRKRSAKLVVSIVKAAAHEVAERKLEARLAECSAEEITVDERVQIECGVSEDDYEIKILRDRTVHTTPEVAEEVAKLLAELEIEHFFDREIRKLAK